MITPELSPRLLEACRYRRFASDKGKVIVIDTGYFIQRECENAFRQCGWDVIKIELEPTEEFIRNLLDAIVLNKPDMLFTVNHLGFDQSGLLSGLLDRIEMPNVSWYVDNPAYILLNHLNNSSYYTVTPVWERRGEDFLKNFGFENTFYLPLATDTSVFNRPGKRVSTNYNVGFVGDSMLRAAAKWWYMAVPFPKKEQVINDAALALVNNRKSDPLNLARKIAEDHQTSLPDQSTEEALTLSSAVVLQATLLYRKKLVQSLAGLELDVFGDERWKEYLPASASLHKGVDYYTELPGLYRRTKINLNATSLQMPTTVNQRVFDAPAAGGFIITDDQDDLEELFDKSGEIVSYQTFEELPDMVRYYSENKTIRDKIADAAAERIYQEHTYKHRIGKIIDYTRKRFAEKAVIKTETNRSRSLHEK